MKKYNRILSLLLCLCLLLGFIPSTGIAAEWITSYDDVITFNAANMGNWADNKSRFENAPTGSAIKVIIVGEVQIPEPLKNTNGANFYIMGEGNDASISPRLLSEEDEEKFRGTHLLTFENTATTPELHIRNVTLDGGRATGLVAVKGYREVRFGTDTKKHEAVDAVTFRKGYIDTGNGGSVRLEEVSLAVLRNCTFTDNKGNGNLPTTGCLYYSMQGKAMNVGDTEPGMFIDTCQFNGNDAHSGGAMYVYGKNAYAYVGPDCVFKDNHATQRGGAIQCHGTVNVDNAIFTENKSDGLGGTIYVSASTVESGGKGENYFGVLTLSGRPNGDTQGFTNKERDSGLTITGSHAGTAGGAVYIAKDATALLMGELHIMGNTVGEDDRDSNIYTASTDGHIVCTMKRKIIWRDGRKFLASSNMMAT